MDLENKDDLPETLSDEELDNVNGGHGLFTKKASIYTYSCQACSYLLITPFITKECPKCHSTSMIMKHKNC